MSKGVQRWGHTFSAQQWQKVTERHPWVKELLAHEQVLSEREDSHAQRQLHILEQRLTDWLWEQPIPETHWHRMMKIESQQAKEADIPSRLQSWEADLLATAPFWDGGVQFYGYYIEFFCGDIQSRQAFLLLWANRDPADAEHMGKQFPHGCGALLRIRVADDGHLPEWERQGWADMIARPERYRIQEDKLRVVMAVRGSVLRCPNRHCNMEYDIRSLLNLELEEQVKRDWKTYWQGGATTDEPTG